jgi:catechol 2,3-dioxygenase-like lactoylglutathione lyase family enzyme
MDNKYTNQFVISGIQQIGIGVPDVYAGWKWYREMFGVGVKIFDEQALADIMAPYMNGQQRQRHAILALNLQGGGGFEVWQHLSTPPHPADFEILPGDLGIFCCKIKTKDVPAAHRFYRSKALDVSPLHQDERKQDTFYLRDPYRNMFQIVRSQDCFFNQNKPTGGVFGAMIGTVDMDSSLHFYDALLGYDTVISDRTDVFPEWDFWGVPQKRFRRIVLTHSQPRQGAFSRVLGSSEIELVQALDRTDVHRIFEGRMWGDMGFIQICFDVRNMTELAQHCQKTGYPFTVDSRKKSNRFGMGKASGNFAYNEDPAGTMIEYVETERIPLVNKPFIALNLKNRDPFKPLPDWFFKVLQWTERRK